MVALFIIFFIILLVICHKDVHTFGSSQEDVSTQDSPINIINLFPPDTFEKIYIVAHIVGLSDSSKTYIGKQIVKHNPSVVSKDLDNFIDVNQFRDFLMDNKNKPIVLFGYNLNSGTWIDIPSNNKFFIEDSYVNAIKKKYNRSVKLKVKTKPKEIVEWVKEIEEDIDIYNQFGYRFESQAQIIDSINRSIMHTNEKIAFCIDKSFAERSKIIHIAGYIGSGKTTLQTRLQNELPNFLFVDLDVIIDDAFNEFENPNISDLNKIQDSLHNTLVGYITDAFSKKVHLVLVGIDWPMNVVDYIDYGFCIDTDVVTNYVRKSLRTMNEICNHKDEITKILNEPGKTIDTLVRDKLHMSVKFKIRTEIFTNPYVERNMINKYKNGLKAIGYKILSAESILDFLKTDLRSLQK
jgi:dephospho-CoA kinase